MNQELNTLNINLISSKEELRNRNRKSFILLTLSFLLPFFIWSIIYVIFGIYPFGNRQIAVSDGWHQYFPFLSDYWQKIHDGKSLFWSWSSIGGDYLAQIGYYLASPFNLIMTLFPFEYYREVITWLIPVKIGLAGLFTSLYLKKAAQKETNLLPIFALFYALCAWICGYCWNVMWVDTFIALPLIMYGLVSFLREDKCIIYIISLAWALLNNFYVGFYVCIFVFLMYLAHSFEERVKMSDFAWKSIKFFGLSLISAGLAAFLLLPAYTALQSTYRSSNDLLPTTVIWYRDLVDVSKSLLAFFPANARNGSINLFSGLLCIPLFGYFISSYKISWRLKTSYTFVLIFILISCNNNILTFIWNAFHYTNGMIARFSFTFSLIFILIGYYSFVKIEEANIVEVPKRNQLRQILIMVIFSFGIILVGSLSEQEGSSLLLNIIWGVCYLTVLALLLILNSKIIKRVLLIVICLLMISEISLTANEGIRRVSYSDRDTYPIHKEGVQSLLRECEEDNSLFYRTELLSNYICNPSSLYGYNGLASFSSTVDVRIGNFIKNIGMISDPGANTYSYRNSSPLYNMIVALKYGIIFSNDVSGLANWDIIATEGEATLLQNPYYLPLGFMVHQDLTKYKPTEENYFENQNNFLKLATNCEENLFDLIDTNYSNHSGYNVTRLNLGKYYYISKNEDSEGKVTFNYTIPADGWYYLYCKIDNCDSFSIAATNEMILYKTLPPKDTFILPLKEYKKGQVVTVSANLSSVAGYATVHLAKLNQDFLKRAHSQLEQEVWTLTTFTETRIKGNVTSTRGGLLYTSIPYNKNWRVYVNGEPTPVKIIDDCMMAVRLGRGEYNIEFRYVNSSFIIGMIISSLSFLLVIFLIIKRIRKGGKALKL